MNKYDYFPKNASPDPEAVAASFPILARHYGGPDFERQPQGFAQEAAADAFKRRWVHPDDQDFTDRPPPGGAPARDPANRRQRITSAMQRAA